jgi:large subunit ribosomal protein L21
MFAVIRTGGKQYRGAEEDTLRVHTLDAKPGEIVTFPVMVLGGESVQIGKPLVEGASVAAEVLAQARGKKIIAFKKRRRQNSRRKRGYRDEFTLVRITEILTGGAKPTKTARPKPEPKPKRPETEEAVEAAAAAPKAKPAKSKAKAKAPAKKPKTSTKKKK